MSNGNLSAAHAFDYIIVFRINPGLTSCKDVATMVDTIDLETFVVINVT